MEDAIIIKYKWSNEDKYGDLVCELTEFFDKYILDKNKNYSWYKTYLYNDISVFSNNGYLQIAFRVPGATRGGIQLERIDMNKFKIIDIHFNQDVCFGEFACYKKQLKEDSKQYIGRILDFSKVELLNNK